KAASILVLSVMLSGCATTESTLNHGLFQYSRGLANAAIPLLTESTAEFEKKHPHDDRTSKAYLALGLMANADNNPTKAEQLLLKALNSANNTYYNKHLVLRDANKALGEFYLSQHRYSAALPLLQATLDSSNNKRDQAILQHANSANQVATALAGVNQKEGAIAHADLALKIITQVKGDLRHLSTKADILLNQASIHAQFDDYLQADAFYQRAISTLKIQAKKYPFDTWRIEIAENAYQEFKHQRDTAK
ncbi:MAG: hypothetical protein COA42_19175, partial [Alteromonadaceae bacterium]